jgi:rSAM/selenodomain-associated transferase 2
MTNTFIHSFSVIIPTLNEAHQIGDRISHVRRLNKDAEIIVVDCASTDGTPDLARAAGASVHMSNEPGRGQQLKVGGEVAGGDIIIFLHADTHLPETAFTAIDKELSDNTKIGGNFRVLFDGESDFASWLNDFYAWFRSKGLYYGDSVVFLRRSVYQHLGGIMPYTVMEDFDLSRKMERLGGTVCIEDDPVVTSSRRFKNRHPAAIFAGWCVLHGLYYIGLSTRALGWVYDNKRRRTSAR